MNSTLLILIFAFLPHDDMRFKGDNAYRTTWLSTWHRESELHLLPLLSEGYKV